MPLSRIEGRHGEKLEWCPPEPCASGVRIGARLHDDELVREPVVFLE
jgi:hypothetical protein